MSNIWRFFDNMHCVSGIVIADSNKEAKERSEKYLVKHFSDIKNIESLDVCVWKIEDDDDYCASEPYAVAVSY